MHERYYTPWLDLWRNVILNKGSCCFWLPPAHVCVCICLQANEYSLPSLNAGLEDVKPSLSTSASADLASSVSQSYSVVTGTIWFTLHWFLKECTQVQQWKTPTTKVVSAEKHKAEQCLLYLISFLKIPFCLPLLNQLNCFIKLHKKTENTV